MKNKIVLFVFVGVLQVLAPAKTKLSPHAHASTCQEALPASVQQAIRAKMGDWKVVSLADLIPDDQQAWKERFGDQCPGVAVGRFSSSQAQSYAVTLIRGKEQARYQTLIVLTKSSSGDYRILTLSPVQLVDVISIVAKLPPGAYSSADDAVHIRSDYDVISYEVNEAGAILYYWDRNRYKSLQTSE